MIEEIIPSYKEAMNMEPKKLFEIILEGKLKRFPIGYWSKEDPDFEYRVSEVVKYLINNKLKLSHNEVCDIVSKNFFYKYKLRGMHSSLGDCTIKILEIAFPEEYQIHELKCYTARIYKLRKDLAWLLGLYKDLPKFQLDLIHKEDFYDNNLGYFFEMYNPNKTIYDIVRDIYPDGLSLYGNPLITNK